MSNAGLNPHGGDIYKASERYGIKKEDFLDFSANINPLGIPIELREHIISNIDSLANYPETQCISLRTHISDYLRIPMENIIIGNGASEIIFLLFDVLKPKKVLIPSPTFSEYENAAKRYGAVIKHFELREENGFTLDVDTLKESISEDIAAIMLCNPNNPTSALISKAELLRLVEFSNSKNIKVIIDEAFIELTESGNGNSLVDYVSEFSNLFIIRAFTKIFAIPGMRLGYGIGSEILIDRMWESKMPWSVNTFACSFGEFLCKADDYLMKTSDWISGEGKWFYNELKHLKKLKVFEPKANFVLVKLLDTDLTAEKLSDFMATRGILIRDASNFKFLDNKYIRIAIKNRSDNEKLIKNLKEALRSKDI